MGRIATMISIAGMLGPRLKANGENFDFLSGKSVSKKALIDYHVSMVE